MKTIRHMYRLKYSTVAQPPGLGDFLRGSISLAMLSLEKNFDLTLDFTNHPIGKFLETQLPPSNPDENLIEFFNDRAGLLPAFTEAPCEAASVAVATNLYPDEENISDAACAIVRRNIILNQDIKKSALRFSRLISSDNFVVLHIRLKDDRFNARGVKIPQLHKYVKDEIIPAWGKRIIILSNNAEIKNLLSKKFKIPLVETRAVHLGECNSGDEEVRDTLIDFALMSKADTIFSYSEYSWRSGFSKWCARIYGVKYVGLVFESNKFFSRKRINFFIERMKLASAFVFKFKS